MCLSDILQIIERFAQNSGAHHKGKNTHILMRTIG